MRRVNIKTGLKQRINEILGTDFGSESFTGAYEITPWSIQAAMLSNVQRISKGIVGEASQGRVMKGLSISYYGPGNNIKITQGYGFTPEGNMVMLEKDLIIPIVQTSDYVYIYLKYILDIATESIPLIHSYGKNTSFNSETGTKEIVYDDQALILGSTVTKDIIEISTDAKNGIDGFIYLGKIFLDGVLSADSVITNTFDKGIGYLASDISVDNITIATLLTAENCFINDDLIFKTDKSLVDFYDNYIIYKGKIDTLYTNNVDDLTASITQQLAKIAVTISAGQWTYLSQMNQRVDTSQNVTFNNITGAILTGSSLALGTGPIAAGTSVLGAVTAASLTTVVGAVKGAITGGTITGETLIIGSDMVGYYYEISGDVVATPTLGNATVTYANYNKIGNIINLELSITIDTTTTALTSVTVVLPNSCKCSTRYTSSSSGSWFFNIMNAGVDAGKHCRSVVGYFYPNNTLHILRNSTSGASFEDFLVIDGTTRFDINISYETA